MLKTAMSRSAIIAFACSLSLSAYAMADEAKRAIHIPSGELSVALELLAKQSGTDLVYRPDQVEGFRTGGVDSELSTVEAVTRLLEGTPLVLSTDSTGAMLIALPTSAFPNEGPQGSTSASERSKSFWSHLRLAQADTPSPSAGEGRDRQQATADQKDPAQSQERIEVEEFVVKGIPEILVKGSKLLNMDIARSRDDAQSYVIYDRQTIEQSNAINLDDFLKQRLPMNSVAGSAEQSGNSLIGNKSELNLRGLGANQTLILIDGHRTSNVTLGSGPFQPDISGIPLAAVERIEVLPATASGIYGGGATGGAVNIILRRDYQGIESKLAYENTFSSDAPIRTVDLSGGTSLEGGKTHVMLALQWSDNDGLSVGDRDLMQRGQQAILANNPNLYFNNAVPPLGATTNIRSQNGSNLTLRDGTALNAPRTFIPAGYAGIDSDDGAALVTNAGRYNLDLARTAQVSVGPGGAGANYPLANRTTRKSVIGTVRREFTPRLNAFAEIAASDNAVDAAYTPFGSFALAAGAAGNPFNQAVRVTVPIDLGETGISSEIRHRRFVGGVLFKISSNWIAEADYTWHESIYNNPDGVLNLFPSAEAAVNAGSIDVFRDLNLNPIDVNSHLGESQIRRDFPTTLRDTTLRFSGPLWELPAGPLRLTGLLEHRERTIDRVISLAPVFGLAVYLPEREQTVDSVYAELSIPLISARNARPGIQLLDLQLLARVDDYKTRTSGAQRSVPIDGPAPADQPATNKVRSVDPTVALRYQPVSDVMLRASYATGFLPPEVDELVTETNQTASVIDPRRGNSGYTVTSANLVSGGNPNLGPEESESWSGGFVLTPRGLPSLRWSVDYTRLTKTDNISRLPFQTIINNEFLFPARVIRGANLPGDPAGWAGPIIGGDATVMNLARAQLEAYDTQLDYRIATAAAGTFDLSLIGTWQKRYWTQALPNAPIEENVGIRRLAASIPLEFKANATLSWIFNQFRTGFTVRYFDSYLVADLTASANAAVLAAQGNGGRVPSQTYVDMFVNYRFPQTDMDSSIRGRLLTGVDMQFGVKNLFDREPPLDVANTATYYSQFGDPRLSSYYLSLKRSF